MKKPASVGQCEAIIYGTVAAYALVSLVDKWLGITGAGEFGLQLIFYGLFCIIPYKLGQGSNPARFGYVIMSVISLFLTLGGGVVVGRLDMVLSVFLVPVTIYLCWTLFQPAASRWFNGGKDDDRDARRGIARERQDPT